MSAPTRQEAPLLRHPDRFFVGGEWVTPSSSATIDVIDPATEQPFLTVASGESPDLARAVAAARHAFDEGPWPRLSHEERAGYLRAFAEGIRSRIEAIGQLWPREAGALYVAVDPVSRRAAGQFDLYADMAATYPWEEQVTPSLGGEFGLLVRQPVGVVAAIIPWNVPLTTIANKVAPALIAGCTVILKPAPEAPGEALLIAEIAEEIGLPPGVLNVVTAEREPSEDLVRDHRVDKVSFTGSTAAGRQIASICGQRIARCTLELGGKSAAVVMDDFEIDKAAHVLATAECNLAGQICASLTRVVVSKDRHDDLVDALRQRFEAVQVGDPYDPTTQMGPLAARRQRDRVEDYISRGVAEGSQLVTGGARPPHLDRGWYVQPTLFAGVDNSALIAREEIFGPVLTVIPVSDEREALRVANDSVYGLNSTVFTNDVDRARDAARHLRTGTVGHNAFRLDATIGFGGFKQSGLGREGGREGLLPFLETQTLILEGVPSGYVEP